MKNIIIVLLGILAFSSCRKEKWDEIERPGPFVRYSNEDLADTVTQDTYHFVSIFVFAHSGMTNCKVWIDDSMATEWVVDGPDRNAVGEILSIEFRFTPDVPETKNIITWIKDRQGKTTTDTLKIRYNPDIYVPNLDLICWGPYLTYNSIITGSHTYQTIKINNNHWVARNLMEVPSTGNYQSVYTGHDSVYGYLYDWNAAMSLFIYEDYHLPTRQEFDDLVNFCGGTSIAGFKLKECGANHWFTFDMHVTSNTGFTAIPGGNGDFATHNLNAWYWTSTEYDADNAWALHLIDNSGTAELVILPKTSKALARHVMIPQPTVQQLLDAGQTPFNIYNMGIPVDSLWGKWYQGGYIFMFSSLFGNGAVCTGSSTFATIWGCDGSITTVNSTGYGLQNSEAIALYCGSSMNAAHYCLNLNINGYDNWYLPSIDELSMLYSRQQQNNIGNYDGVRYWSSSNPSYYTPNSYLNGIAFDFSDGSTDTLIRGTGLKYIAIHSF